MLVVRRVELLPAEIEGRTSGDIVVCTKTHDAVGSLCTGC